MELEFLLAAWIPIAGVVLALCLEPEEETENAARAANNAHHPAES